MDQRVLCKIIYNAAIFLQSCFNNQGHTHIWGSYASWDFSFTTKAMTVSVKFQVSCRYFAIHSSFFLSTGFFRFYLYGSPGLNHWSFLKVPSLNFPAATTAPKKAESLLWKMNECHTQDWSISKKFFWVTHPTTEVLHFKLYALAR